MEKENNSQSSSLKACQNRQFGRTEENDELIIEDNTIYEIDLNCYECLMKEKQKRDFYKR